jgi:hypothetical protein
MMVIGAGIEGCGCVGDDMVDDVVFSASHSPSTIFRFKTWTTRFSKPNS